MRALIGYTGFVGGNLCQQGGFDATYNSKNFEDMSGKHFHEIFCAGVSAVKWKANKEPQIDRDAIAELKNVLRTVKADRFVLISTIDVYPFIQGGDEHTNVHGIENHAYGSNRLDFEDFCYSQFKECFVLRLPGLFGANLRKNVIYDLLNDNCLEAINPLSTFQYYNLANLTKDIERAIEANVRLLNVFSEPVSTQTIIDRFFPGKKVGAKAGGEAHYDIGTAYARLWGRQGRYQMDKETLLHQMQDFISSMKTLRGNE